MDRGSFFFTGYASLCWRLLRQALGAVVFFLMVSIAVMMFAQAVDRYLIGSGFSAYDQLAKIAMIWLAFLGLPLVLMHRENIAADLIAAWMGKRLKALRTLIFDATMAGLAAMILWYGRPVMRVGAFQEIIGTPFTYWSVYLGLNIGMLLTVIVLIARILSALLSRNGALKP